MDPSDAFLTPQNGPERYASRVAKNGDPTVVDLLERLRGGDAEASEALLQVVYDELHGRARRLMSRQAPSHTLQTTALVNEAWMRLAGGQRNFNDREHFLRVAASAMRSVLVDHARRRTAGKRRRDLARPLETDPIATLEKRPEDLLLLEELLERLGEVDADLLKIVELKFFGGMTLEETGAVMGMTVRQVHRRWVAARGWLRTEIERGNETSNGE